MELLMNKFVSWFKRPDSADEMRGPSTSIIMGEQAKRSGPRKLPLIGSLPINLQYQVTATIAGLFLILSIFTLTYHTIQLGYISEYVATATEMQMLSQRIAKNAQQAVLGNPEAFTQLSQAKDKFAKDLNKLIKGGDGIPPSPKSVSAILNELAERWQPASKNIDAILPQEQKMVELNESVASINLNNLQLLDLSDQIVKLIIQSNGSANDVYRGSQLSMLSQRIAKNANALLSSDLIDPEVALLLEKDVETFRNLIKTIGSGVHDSALAKKLTELETFFKQFTESTTRILQSMEVLASAKQSGRETFTGSDRILLTTQKLSEAYEREEGRRILGPGIATIFGVLALVFFALLALVYVYDSKRKTHESEQANATNQAAILRLLNEMDSLADGDLTVRALVTEDITGAIADSVNLTIDELRTLVTGINKVTGEVSHASVEAQAISNQLLQAAERQSQEIKDTSASVLDMARSINEVSANAAESARVAKQSLNAAEQGAVAVQNTIAGMNEIREQIQETAKKIKRLGESSQEIGEIVELISDITEQTNVLALNAAIQAASAGEAGRGFTVVAEEVQRLAERSGEATKQIGAIVKTIQADTQDAVAAMEKSTQGVVEGARLSDAAGQALQEIGNVSRNLAELSASISAATQAQAESTGKVAKNMQEILLITDQTTQGTKKTALSIGQLAELAAELKGSVSRFKL